MESVKLQLYERAIYLRSIHFNPLFTYQFNIYHRPLSYVSELIDSMPNAFRNLTISKAAQTHVLRKLRTPSKCRECDSYVYFNGAECEKCGLASHKKCLEYLAIQCGGKRLQGKMNVFGVPLETHLRATGRSCPFIVTKCISEIESKAMNTKVS